MPSPKTSHFTSYIVFVVEGILIVGTVVYILVFTGMGKNLQSSLLGGAQEIAPKNPEVISGEVPIEKETSPVDNSGRRIRLTQMLIRSQKELQTLEGQRKSSPQGLDPLSEQKMLKIQEKVVNLKKMITEIK